MVDSIPTPPNTLGNVSGIISQLAPLFLGSGKTTTTARTTASPGAMALNDQITSGALAKANDPTATNDIVANIMRQAAIAFAPIVGQQNNAGMYNSQTLQLLSQQAQANATGQAAQAVLNFQTSQEQIAQAASAAGLNASRTTTQTSQTAPTIDPTLSLLAGGVSAAFSGAKALFPDEVKSAGNYLKSAVGLGPKVPNVVQTGGSDAFLKTQVPLETSANAPIEGVSSELLDGSVPPGGGQAVLSGGVAGDVTTGGLGNVGSGTADASSFITSTGDSFGGVGGNSVVDFASSGITDGLASTAGSVGADTAASTAADAFASDVAVNGASDATDLLGSDAAAGASSIAGDISASAGDIGAGVASDAFSGVGSDLASVGADVGDFTADAATSLGSEIGSDIAGAATGLAGGISAVGGIIHTIGSVVGGDGGTALEAVGDLISPANGIADVGAAIGTAVGGDVGQGIEVLTDPLGAIFGAAGSICCGVLHTQGKLSSRLYFYNLAHFGRMSRRSQDAYWLWATPLAKYLISNPDTRIAKAIGWLFRSRAEYIAAMGKIRGSRKTASGLLCTVTVWSICFLCGLAIIASGKSYSKSKSVEGVKNNV